MTAISIPVYGWQAELAFGDTWPIVANANSGMLQFDVFNMALDENFADNNGIRATTAHSGELISPSKRKLVGQLTTHPTTLELSRILQWAFAGTPSGSPTVTYPLSDVLATDANNLYGRPTRYGCLALAGTTGSSTIHKFTSIAVGALTLRGSGEGEQKLEVILDLVGVDEADTAATFPGGLSLDTTTPVLMFNELTLTVRGHTYFAADYEGTWNWGIDAERFLSSITLTALMPTDRHVGVNFNLPWGDANQDYGFGVAGMAVNAAFATGSSALTIAYNNVKFPRKGPQVRGRGQEVLQRMIGTSYKTGTSTLESIVTLHQ